MTIRENIPMLRAIVEKSFDDLFDKVPTIFEVLPDHHNGTGYFDDLVFTRFDSISKGTDVHGRKILVIPITENIRDFLSGKIVNLRPKCMPRKLKDTERSPTQNLVFFKRHGEGSLIVEQYNIIGSDHASEIPQMILLLMAVESTIK